MNFKFTISLFYFKKRLLKLIVRTFIFLCCTLAFAFGPKSGFSQNAKIVINKDKIMSVKQMFKLINKQTDYKFIYRHDFIKDIPKFSLKKGTIKTGDLLDRYLSPYGFSYSFTENNTVIVHKKPKNTTKPIEIQQQTVTGKIVDENGQPLAGASVIEKGTTNGTQADFDGNFSINVTSKNAILTVSYLGFLSQEVTIGDQDNITIALEEDVANLDEVVVVGYGTKTKGALTGATSTVKSEQFASRPQTEVVTSLQGAAPGLLVTRGSGDVGFENNNIQIRGITSRNDPGVLIVIDGIPQRQSDARALNSLNPQDIENLTILKDAQAAIYGARAAGGVIIVTTKKGKSGKPQFSYDTNVSIVAPVDSPRRTNLIQHMAMASEAFENDGNANHFFRDVNAVVSAPGFQLDNSVIPGPFGDTPTTWLGHTEWADVMWGTDIMHSHNLSVSGRTDKSNYYVSVGVLDQNSTLKFGKNSNLRYFTRVKYDYQVIDNILKLGTNISLEKQKIERPNEYNRMLGSISGAWSSMPLYTPGGNYYNFGGFTPPHAFAIDGGDDIFTNYRTRLQFSALFTPFKGFSINTDFSTNLDVQEYDFEQAVFQFHNYNENPSFRNRNNGNAFGSRYTRNTHQVSNVYATYDTSFGNHNINVVAGTSHEEVDDKQFAAWRRDVNEGLRVFGNGDPEQQFNSDSKSQYAISSYFGRLSYDFDKKYIVEANYRRDGSSRFAEEFRWGDFFGVSAGWVISKEAFLSNLNIFDNLKLRASYGQLGNQNNVGRFDHFSRIGILGELPFGNPTAPVRAQLTGEVPPLASQVRTWETVNAYNYALDFAILDSRLSGTIDYFFKNTTDILFGQDFPETLGIAPPTVNGGELEVKGIELTLNWQDKIGDFEYFINANYFDNTSEVTSLLDSQVVRQGFNALVEGYSAGSYFGLNYQGLITDQATLDEYKTIQGVPGNLRIGDAMFEDTDGDGIIEPGRVYEEGNPDSGDLIYLGNNNRRHNFFLSFGANYKGFDFSAQFQGVGAWKIEHTNSPLGGNWWVQPHAYQYNQTFNEADRPNATWPKLTSNGGIDGWNWRPSNAAYRLQDNPYVRLKNLQFGYTLPSNLVEKISLSKVRVYFSGNDLWEAHKLPQGSDPENFYRFVTPFNRQYSIGLNVTF